jgi:hypothetical protein
LEAFGVSPILVRPVREQLEHDRIIRLLQAKSRRRYEAGINPGIERNVPVGTGAASVYPDVVLQSLERGRKLEAVVEVETGESVNHLEALAQWAHFARLRAPFHLYVPSSMVDVARRLCEDNQIEVNEIWTYHTIGDEVRFTLVHRSRETAAPKARAGAPAPRRKAPAVKRATQPAAKPAARRPAKKAKKAPSRQKRK